MKDISQDMPRTFPSLSFFHDGGDQQQNLSLLCFLVGSESGGYVQGMSYVVAMLLLQMGEADAYRSALTILSPGRWFPDGYNPAFPPGYLTAWDAEFAAKLPLLKTHLDSLGLTPEMYLVDWRLSLFTRFLPLDACVRVWDTWILGGEPAFPRSCLQVMSVLGSRLGRAEELGEAVKVLKGGGGEGWERITEGGGGGCMTS